GLANDARVAVASYKVLDSTVQAEASRLLAIYSSYQLAAAGPRRSRQSVALAGSGWKWLEVVGSDWHSSWIVVGSVIRGGWQVAGWQVVVGSGPPALPYHIP
ncbi:hypothetical protein V493_05944, partial [Pseudogymnoascus sp. VKM F-4281 (FW-2241)]